MTATAHALVGGAIAASVPDPALGITLSFASHPLLDMIPHWDEGWGWRKKTKLRLFVESGLDLGLGVVLAYIFFGHQINIWYFFAAVVASESWDLMQVPYLLFNLKIPPFCWFYQMQHKIQGKARLPWGILTQVATVGGIFLGLQIFH